MTQWFKARLNGDTFQVIALFVCIGIVAAGFSCVSKVSSLQLPLKYISRAELDAEVISYKAMADARYSDLNAQDEAKRTLLNSLQIVSEQGSINMNGIVSAAFSILGVGAIADNVKYRRKSKYSSKSIQPTAPPT